MAQTALAIIANPPAGCDSAAEERIPNRDLERIFRGAIKNWSELETARESCTAPMTRVVRKDGTGITKQLKNYLSLANEKGLPCTSGGTEGKASWQELEPVSTSETGAPSTKWPESCKGTTLSTVVKPSAGGGGEEVKKVNGTPGSIGYVALPEAMAYGAVDLLEIDNNGQKNAVEATYANPVAASAQAKDMGSRAFHWKPR